MTEGRALEILDEARRLCGGSPIVFARVRGRGLADKRFARMLEKLGIAAVPHGFRSSFRDWAAEETDHPREVAEAALAHKGPQPDRGRVPAHGPVRAPSPPRSDVVAFALFVPAGWRPGGRGSCPATGRVSAVPGGGGCGVGGIRRASLSHANVVKPAYAMQNIALWRGVARAPPSIPPDALQLRLSTCTSSFPVRRPRRLRSGTVDSSRPTVVSTAPSAVRVKIGFALVLALPLAVRGRRVRLSLAASKEESHGNTRYV